MLVVLASVEAAAATEVSGGKSNSSRNNGSNM